MSLFNLSFQLRGQYLFILASKLTLTSARRYQGRLSRSRYISNEVFQKGSNSQPGGLKWSQAQQLYVFQQWDLDYVWHCFAL